MFIVTVKFTVIEKHFTDFLGAMQKQAQDSLALEDNCHQFDVCQSMSDPFTLFLYEIYSSELDFNEHLKSAHFIQFSKKVAPWVFTKTVETYLLAGC
jgi:(4S)-4-hydroxy-5-phosphonooxypentane-2,3-dione isomerase